MTVSWVRFRIATRLVATIVVLLGVLLAGAGKKPDDSKADKVTIKNLKYDPSSLKIAPGETVLWINEDDSDHTVTSDDPHNKEFRSDNLGNGDTFRYTFEKPGKFAYHCKYHPRMKGIVVVSR